MHVPHNSPTLINSLPPKTSLILVPRPCPSFGPKLLLFFWGELRRCSSTVCRLICHTRQNIPHHLCRKRTGVVCSTMPIDLTMNKARKYMTGALATNAVSRRVPQLEVAHNRNQHPKFDPATSGILKNLRWSVKEAHTCSDRSGVCWWIGKEFGGRMCKYQEKMQPTLWELVRFVQGNKLMILEARSAFEWFTLATRCQVVSWKHPGIVCNFGV